MLLEPNRGTVHRFEHPRTHLTKQLEMAFKLVVFSCLVACAYGSVAVAPAAQLVAAPLAARLEEFDPAIQYQYGYSVSDALTGDYKTQDEQRDGDLVRGRYTLVDPDNTLRTVDYTADSVNGFNAVVRKEPLVSEAVVPAAPVAPARIVAPAPAPVYAAPTRYAVAPVAAQYAVAPAAAPYAVAPAAAPYAVAPSAPARYAFAPAPVAARVAVAPAVAPARYALPAAAAPVVAGRTVAYASPYTAAYTVPFSSASVSQYTATGPVAAYTQYPAAAAYYAAAYSAAPVAAAPLPAAPAKLVNAAPAVAGYRYP